MPSTARQHLVYDKDPRHVLMRNVDPEGCSWQGHGSTCVADVWFGKGRICFLSPGPTEAVYRNPEFAKLLKNAVRWLLRVE